MPVKAKAAAAGAAASMHTLLPFHHTWYHGEDTVWNKVAAFLFLLQPLAKLNFPLCTLPRPLPIDSLSSGNSHCLLLGQQESLL